MKIVFTNGCFDILHMGHIELLRKAKSFGDKLIVGLNSDRSIYNLKGKDRPYMDEESRSTLLEAIRYVDEVLIFNDVSVLNLIKTLKPDVLVKGGDYKIHEIVGSDIVLDYGGKVEIIDIVDNYSSTKYINLLKKDKF